jgi:hypothetical protein
MQQLLCQAGLDAPGSITDARRAARWPTVTGLPDGTTATTSQRAPDAHPAVLPSPCAPEVPCDGYAWFTDMSDDGTPRRSRRSGARAGRTSHPSPVRIDFGRSTPMMRDLVRGSAASTRQRPRPVFRDPGLYRAEQASHLPREQAAHGRGPWPARGYGDSNDPRSAPTYVS